MIVLLVRGLIFLAASVILVYAQDADSTSRHQPVIAGTGKADLRAPAAVMNPFVAERKIEVVEIFSTGEEVVTPPIAAATSGFLRRAVAARRRAKR